MLKQNLVQKTYTIKGNEPVLLDDPQTVWVVKSGSLVLFSTLIEEREQKGSRSYLFNVNVGEALFGAALAPGLTPEEERGIIAVALEETELQQLSFEDFVKLVAARETEAIALLEGWIHHLGEWVSKQPNGVATPANVLPAQASHFLSLVKGQVLQPERGTVAWVDVHEGSTRWLGVENLKLYPDLSVVLPLAPQMWLEAEDQVEVYTTPTAELENTEQVPRSLAQLHAYFFEYFNLLKQQETEAEFRRFQERQQLNRKMAEISMGELAGVLQPQEKEAFEEGEPLLVAVGAVGRAMGIKISPPGKSEDLSRVKDPLEAIARASQFRTRRVLLVGNWWTEDNGSLLTYTFEDKKPVALLLDKDNRYVLFDPAEGTRTPVDESVAENLSPEAYMFYRPLPQFVSSTFGIFLFGIKGYERDIATIVVLGLLGTLLGMVTPQATAILINNAIPDSDRLLVGQLGLALFAAAIGKSVFQLAQGIVTLRLESAADSNLQPAVWDRMLKLKPQFFRQYSSGELVSRLLAVGQIRDQLSGATQRTLLSGVFSLLNLGLMFVYSPPLAMVAVCLTLLVIIVTISSSRLLIKKERRQEELDGEITGLTVELINGVAKLRVAAAEERAFAAWAKKYSQRVKLQAGIKRIDDAVSVFNEALPLVSSALMFWFAILFIQIAQTSGGIGGLTAGTFLAFNAAFGIFLDGATDISDTVTDILEIFPLWERAQPILQSEPESDPSKEDPGRLTGRLSLEHVTFRYREDGPLILDDVSIHAEPGEFIALVGPSGSGKSTVFRLLLGFETPLSGIIYYDAQDLASLDIQAVRRQLGVVLQNVRISSASIFESITAGALVTLDEAWEAARMAGFDEDIKAMPMGMHTIVSEGGTNLSGGQRQRLLIARSLVLKPKIILMDEATSALDNRTQAIVTESLDRMNTTRIVVAHRLSTIRNADRIYVVEAGRVVQVGNFDELASQEGLFARLVARQLD
ncbi:MAG: NHLP bacteriocin export ABC transporter permease/ATPase subunit [Xenococcaceae cyanobacterium]